MDEPVDYGNWVPKNLLYSAIVLIIILIIFSLFPLLLILRIILWVLSVVLLFACCYLFLLYYHFTANNKELQYKIWDFVVQKLPWNGKGKALDVGTGAGALAIRVAKHYPHSKIYGIDSWGKMWNYSKRMCEKNAEIEGVSSRTSFQKTSACKLPFNDEEFDAIVSNFVFHEVRNTKDKTKAIKEAFRVLKKGGSFVLQDIFKKKRKFGTIETLISNFKKWGVEEVNYEYIIDEIEFPKILRAEFSSAILFYGIK